MGAAVNPILLRRDTSFFPQHLWDLLPLGFAFSLRALSFVSCTIFLFLVNKKKSILNMS